MRNSPLARSPPVNLPNIPGVTSPKENNHDSGHPEPIEEKSKKGALIYFNFMRSDINVNIKQGKIF